MMKKPSVIVAHSSRVPKKASRLDLVLLELAAAGIVFRRLLMSTTQASSCGLMLASKRRVL